MTNQVCVIGRLTENPRVEEESSIITLSVMRSYKNVDGEYEADIIPCRLWKAISENVTEYCRKGDLLGVRGRLQSKDGNIEFIAEKVTFLTSKKVEEE